MGPSPLAVTAKVPAVFSANDFVAAEVNTGPEVVTVRLKACDDVLELASVALMLNG